MAYKVSDFMTKAPHSIEPHQTLPQALERMTEHNCTHLPVLSGKKILGILSERDINFMRSFTDIDFEKIPVLEVMTDEPYTVAPDASISAVAAKMVENRIGSALVEGENGSLAGIFTTTDALRAIQKLCQ